MNTKQFRYVLVLAREESFSKAAEVLNISQPSLSQYIKKIETEVGMQLFDRSGSNIRITDAGRVYIEAGRKILDIEHQIENAISDLNENKTGSLIIGAPPYRAAVMMPLIARQFQKVFPGMHLIVRERTTAELVEGMEHGEYDMALTLLPIDKRLFNFEIVAEEELLLAVPEHFEMVHSETVPNRRYQAVETSVLDGKSLVMLAEGQFMQKQLESLCLDNRLTVHPAVVVKSLEAQIEMVKSGVGMALVPSGVERFCKSGEVRFYSFIQDLPRRQVAVFWRKECTLSYAETELKRVIHSIEW